MLTRNISDYWESIYPALRGRDDPKMAAMARTNALRQLENDDNGLLGDLRFGLAFSPRGVGPVTFGDLAAVSFSDFDVLSRSASGLSKAEQDAILARHNDRAKRTALACRAMASEQTEDITAMLAGIGASLTSLETLSTTFGEKSGDTGLVLPELTEVLTNCRNVLAKALSEAKPDTTETPKEATATAQPAESKTASITTSASSPVPAASTPTCAINSRGDVEAALDRIVAFYERTEPSSPIPHVARRLRRMVSMDFLQLMQEVAPSGLKEFRNIAGIEENKK